MNNTNTNQQGQQQEKVIIVRNQSRRSLAGYYLLAALFLFLGIYSIKRDLMAVFGVIFLAAFLISIAVAEKKVHYTKFTVTDKRAVYEEGIMKKDIRTIRYASITDISSRQSFPQRMLNYGDLTIMTSGAKKDYEIVVKKIGSPNKVRSMVEKFVLSSRHHL